ncbi:MAG: UvrD-helicase domain-containing protein, partial [Gammaproteobacteria bacterium]|nr:UvrD-helicase domain-containing protein [Gammaproteobacteria bacterium]
MDVSHILDPLNEAQREAVSAPEQNLLIVAGAGSGKTRVLTHRIAWMVQVEGLSPYAILAVTFTNKAAAEMRGRIEQLMNRPVGGMWVGTFHGIAHRLLRAHWQEANLPKTFQILDGDDQYRVIRRILKALELDESKYAPREAQWFINGKKDEGIRADKLQDNGDHHRHQLIRIYKLYEEQCQRGGMVDFAELLLRTHDLLKNTPSVLEHYRQRFSKILVDEFQDTNTIQYNLLKLLSGSNGSMFAVGDDDQSIYGWRGAKIENIHQYNRDFKGVRTVRLEQNYRSTKNILGASNALIENNTERLGKELWTEGKDGDLITLYTAFNELD